MCLPPPNFFPPNVQLPRLFSCLCILLSGWHTHSPDYTVQNPVFISASLSLYCIIYSMLLVTRKRVNGTEAARAQLSLLSWFLRSQQTLFLCTSRKKTTHTIR